MTRRKSDFKWTLVLVLIVCPYVYSRPQESLTTSISNAETTESPLREPELKIAEQNASKSTVTPTEDVDTSREVKTKTPAIKDSIKKVADQLLEKSSNDSSEPPLVPDTRIPPKLKTQITQKNKIRTRNEDGDENIEYSHAGIAVPVTMEELELENKVNPSSGESSTSNDGISTWILLNNPVNKENSTVATEATKTEDSKKAKPPTKNKTKRPQNKPPMQKRPIIGSTNKSDLVAGGSAINENVYNKIKDTVLSNVQKNKNSPNRITSTTTTTVMPTTEVVFKKEPVTKKPDPIIPTVKVTSKPTKKKEKLKRKTGTTLAPIPTESAMLPMEAKEQEIELEISTPATTTKKPKRKSTKTKTKTKKRKTSKPKPTSQTSATTELKTANKTKTTKTTKKPTAVTGPFTSQIYNYFSREVMPSVGVGVIGLAGLVGIASYFLYPFATPVRRTFEVDKKDDIYRNNAEEYANEGNGQPEEEMLGTVLAGMPAHAKQKLNPYAAQTNYNARYPIKKEQQDNRYRHVTKYDPNHNVHYPQQKTGIAHGAVYSEPLNYHRRPQYETRHAYTTSYPAVEPIYAAPQTGPSAISSYGSDASSSVVYGVKPSADTDFKPVYPYDSQFYGETTSSTVTYSPTSMYLGSNNESEQSENDKYVENTDVDSESDENKFVVGNVPKELTDSDTPAVVPEHGPRKLNRKRRNIRPKRAIAIEEILEAANKKEKEVFLSNEIDEALSYVPKNPQSSESVAMSDKITSKVIPIYAVSVNPSDTAELEGTTKKEEVIESVSTVPIENSNNDSTTEADMSNDIEVTTKSFRIYEVLPSSSPSSETEKNNAFTNIDEGTQNKNANTDITTDFKVEATSTIPTVSTTTKQPNPTDFPEILTYPPPSSSNGFFDFLQRLVEFKYKLGLSILQNTSKSLNNYLRSMEDTIQRAATASH